MKNMPVFQQSRQDWAWYQASDIHVLILDVFFIKGLRVGDEVLSGSQRSLDESRLRHLEML